MTTCRSPHAADRARPQARGAPRTSAAASARRDARLAAPCADDRGASRDRADATFWSAMRRILEGSAGR